MHSRRPFVVAFLGLVLLGTVAHIFAQTAPQPPIKAEIRHLGQFTYVSLECFGPYTQFAAKEQAFFEEFRRAGLRAIGPEMAIYWNSPLFVPPEQLKWEIAFPVAPGTRAKAPLAGKTFPPTKVMATVHVGSYLTTYQTINALYALIAARGLKTVGGPCLERYLDPDPARVPDDRKRTEILIPIQ